MIGPLQVFVIRPKRPPISNPESTLALAAACKCLGCRVVELARCQWGKRKRVAPCTSCPLLYCLGCGRCRSLPPTLVLSESRGWPKLIAPSPTSCDSTSERHEALLANAEAEVEAGAETQAQQKGGDVAPAALALRRAGSALPLASLSTGVHRRGVRPLARRLAIVGVSVGEHCDLGRHLDNLFSAEHYTVPALSK